jgi:hypothetical protein
MRSIVLCSMLLALSACGHQEVGAVEAATPVPSPTNEVISTTKKVLLWAGPGVWTNDAQDLKARLSSMGVAYDSVTSFADVEFNKYVAVIMPGGWAPTQGSAIAKADQERLKLAVSNGLNYLGHCAGGFLLGNYYTQYLDFFDVGLDYPRFFYQGHHVYMNKQTLWDGTSRYILYDYGPDLTPIPGKVLGRYSNGATSIVELNYGKGLMIATGGHPEVSQATIRSEGVYDPDGDDSRVEKALIQAVVTGVGI